MTIAFLILCSTKQVRIKLQTGLSPFDDETNRLSQTDAKQRHKVTRKQEPDTILAALDAI